MKKQVTLLLFFTLLIIIWSCSSTKDIHKKNDESKIEENIIEGAWKQVLPASKCPLYFNFSNEKTELKHSQNYYMRGSCDYRKVKRVWHCRTCDNQQYRDYRGSHYSIVDNKIYFTDPLDRDTIQEEIITIIALKKDTFKMSIYNRNIKIFDTLSFAPISKDSIPIGWQRCEYEWRTD